MPDDLKTGLDAIETLLQTQRRVSVAVEGKCGAGKTTFAFMAEKRFGASVIHMDDFYLPFPKRKAEWKSIPGGNMDFDRFNSEVATQIQMGKAPNYRRYSCRQDTYSDPILVESESLIIVEGNYCRHPSVKLEYDLSIYINCSERTQAERLRKREGNNYVAFQKQWIPAEENYCRVYSIDATSDLILVNN